jgi:hypothetical protein
MPESTKIQMKDTARRVWIVLACAYMGQVFGTFIFRPEIDFAGLFLGAPLLTILAICIPYLNVLLAAIVVFSLLFTFLKWPYYLAGIILIGFVFLGYWVPAAWKVH